jgi:hypothetical protein
VKNSLVGEVEIREIKFKDLLKKEYEKLKYQCNLGDYINYKIILQTIENKSNIQKSNWKSYKI